MLAAERTATGRFAPGRSGNPAGRPPGSRNRSTLALDDALAAHTEELVDLLLRSAADGKGAALRICFDRIAPLRKGRPVPFELPPLACHADLVAAASTIVAGMADGELTPAEAQDMFKVLEAFHKVLTLPARQAPAAGAGVSRRPGEPVETCQSTGLAAGAGDENAEALDPVPTSPATVHRPAPPAAAETSRQPTPAETCKSPRPEAGPDDEDAGTRDPTSMAMPDPAPPLIAEATRQPQEPVETCKSPESDAGGSDDNGGHGAAPDPAGTGTDALATGTGNSEPPRDPPVPVRTPLIASSGDPIADRRYGRARDYEEAGDLPAAAELLLQALQRAPHFASAWFALGDIRERLRDRDGAIAAFRQALDADRGDPHGAGLRLVRLGTSGPGRPMSPGYVRALFDQMAPRFEAELVGGLGYRGPQLLRQAVERVSGAGVPFERMIDLGCGTGLAAEAFAPLCRTAIGIDLSPVMIEIARRKRLYVDLSTADMTERLAREPDSSADLVVAADAFVYLGDLTPVCREAARVLTPSGLLAFSVETHPGPGVILGETLRWAHGAGAISATLDAAGLAVRIREPASVRHEGGVAVPGLIVVASPARPPPGWAGRRVPRGRR